MSAHLVKTVGGTADLQYGYDGAGNRTSVQVNANPAITTAYDSAGLPVTSSDGTTYAYDALGDLKSMTGGSRVWTFTYDVWARTARAQGAGGTPDVTYTYDALDRMASRTKAGVTTTTKYVGVTEDLAKAVVGSVTVLYAQSLSGPLAQKINSGNPKLFIPNMHGDLSLVASTAGAITSTVAYGPFGDKRVTTGTDDPAFSFQSDLTDADTGLVDMGTRLYDPVVARFTTRDIVFGEPKRPLSLNQYAYGWDNPVTLDDPTGMCVYDCFGVVPNGDHDGDGGNPTRISGPKRSPDEGGTLGID